ncbi:alpha/beta fold hydrolase [Gordonia shandongensis]|uniref:alpha/beta fold hydrolase n=1 Tax=Gordonia shandongensis TaxID=376351 RepID=UPI0004033FAD|nr:alpha/beta fold hydrolase [Gordonia shandongensis]
MHIEFVPDVDVYPFTSRWFDSSVGRVHYIDEGEGPVIILCHGAPTWSFLYRHVVTDLARSFRCIAIDNPGFGLSDRPDGFTYEISALSGVAGELIDHLDLDDIIVAGHDWGGPIGLGAAVRRADRVRGVVAMNTIFWPVEALANRVFSAAMSTGPMQKAIVDRNLLIERVLLPGLRGTITESEADHYRAVQPNAEARVALAVMPQQIRKARPFLSDLAREVPHRLGHVPAVAAWGMRDRVFRPADCLPRIAETFADVTMTEVRDAGHCVTEDAPGMVATAIRARFG